MSVSWEHHKNSSIKSVYSPKINQQENISHIQQETVSLTNVSQSKIHKS